MNDTPMLGRCDRCGIPVRKYGCKAINKDGLSLILCGHDTGVHRPALEKQGWTVVSAEVVLEALAAEEIATEPAQVPEPIADGEW